MSFEILWNEIRPMYHTKRARESQTEKEESREKKKNRKNEPPRVIGLMEWNAKKNGNTATFQAIPCLDRCRSWTNHTFLRQFWFAVYALHLLHFHIIFSIYIFFVATLLCTKFFFVLWREMFSQRPCRWNCNFVEFLCCIVVKLYAQLDPLDSTRMQWYGSKRCLINNEIKKIHVYGN